MHQEGARCGSARGRQPYLIFSARMVCPPWHRSMTNYVYAEQRSSILLLVAFSLIVVQQRCLRDNCANFLCRSVKIKRRMPWSAQNIEKITSKTAGAENLRPRHASSGPACHGRCGNNIELIGAEICRSSFLCTHILLTLTRGSMDSVCACMLVSSGLGRESQK